MKKFENVSRTISANYTTINRQAAIIGVYGGRYGEPEQYMITISPAKQNGCSMNHPIMFYPCYEYLLHT
ncbi:hypothetical protein ACTXT7_007958 [Hymenolepis weldensis]